MLNWFSKFFKKNSKKKPLSLRKRLETLQVGDLIQIKLESNFCGHAKTQPLLRFSNDELEKQLIRGIVSNGIFRPDVGCFVLEVLTTTIDSFGVAKGKSISVLEDEIENFIKYE